VSNDNNEHEQIGSRHPRPDAHVVERRWAAGPLLGDMAAGGAAEDLHPKDLVLGKHDAQIIDFVVELEPLPGERLIVTWVYRFLAGPMKGRCYRRYQPMSEASNRHLDHALTTVTQQQEVKTYAELYDPEWDTAGYIRPKVVGARVQVLISRAKRGDTTYTNVDPVELIEPAPSS
jgi:hypothetical protein